MTLGPSDAVALAGRVLGPDDRPLAGALVLIKSKGRGTGPPSWQESNVTLEGVDSIRTGADGRFATPRELEPDRLYRAEVVAAGMARARTTWIDPPATAFPDLALRRSRGLRSVAGRVVDRAGEPVAGAVVAQAGDGPTPTRAIADADGRFRVDGVLDGRAFLFASKPGFRIQARAIDPGASGVDVVLVRDREQPAPINPPTFPTTRVEEKAMARGLIALVKPRIEADKDDRGRNDRATLLALEARLDPDRVIAMIQDQVIRADQELGNVALGLIEDQPGEALDLIDSDRDDAGASAAFLKVFDELGPSRASLRRRVLERAERRARAAGPATSPGFGEPPLVGVADGWLDLGDRDRAAGLVREARAVRDRPADGLMVVSSGPDPLLKVLARLDVPAALAILDRDGGQGQRDYWLAGVAPRFAAVDPAAAEQLLKRFDQEYQREQATRPVCFAMAPRDLPRARRLAATLKDPGVLPVLDALDARSKVATDPRAARVALDSAFEQFERLAAAPGGRGARSEVAASMAMCLPVAARIDPALVPEYLARCLAARPDRSDEPDREAVPNAALLAMRLARYDREAASIVFERVPEGLAAPTTNPHVLQSNAIHAILREAAAFDPRAALAVLDLLPDDPTGPVDTRWEDYRKKLDSRLALATALSRPLDRRRVEAAGFSSRAWPLDDLD